MKFLKNYGKFILIFVLVFLIYNFFCYAINYGDPIAFFGFSNALVRGEIPYVDFNIISTPLCIFYFAIGLLFCNNYIIFLLEQALLVTIMFYLLFKLFGKKTHLIILGIALFGFYAILPTYNFMCFFMMIILLYLEEKYPGKDYLIGFCLGLAILSKHTVGILFIIPSIIVYFKNYKKLLKRFIGLIIPCIIFIIYLVINQALFKFIDLCFLGLFDFSKNSGNYFNIFFFISIIIFIISLVITIKHHNKISNYYLLLCFFFTIPLFDYIHFSLYFIAFLILLIPYIKIDNKYLVFWCCFLTCIFTFTFAYNCFQYKAVVMRDIKHFKYLVNTKYNYKKWIESKKIIDKYDDFILLSYFSMQYDIMSDRDITYYDVLLNGNYGYNGTEKMIKKIKDSKEKIIIVDMESYNNKSVGDQFSNEIVDYVRSHYQKIATEENFLIYSK